MGYTNLDYILGLLPEAKKIESELKDYEKQLQAQLQSKYTEYEKKLQDYQKGVQANLFTDLIKEDKEKELMNMQNSIKQFEENAQNSLQKKQVSLLEPVLEKIQKAIDQVAEENNYSYIFSTHADYGGSAIILYAKSKEDNISDLVLKKLGVTPPAAGATDNTGIGTGTGTGAGSGTTQPKPTESKPAGSGAPVKKK
ncbi:ompH family outer membrane protein [Sporocytophaga myxococcoides]|uniref:OmpH family outer membrane protein n=1 Tax=Sporocytophaga myxococcoides TaxID=153721 RepID=A0A098LN88_9BACT|nr:ompH family outer membrane protein [Sporocytophaga myxococcoides]